MSRAASVHEGDSVLDQMDAALGKKHEAVVSGLLNAMPLPRGVRLKDAKRVLRELNAMMEHAEKHRDQIDALLRAAKSAADRLVMDVALVIRQEKKHEDDADKNAGGIRGTP